MYIYLLSQIIDHFFFVEIRIVITRSNNITNFLLKENRKSKIENLEHNKTGNRPKKTSKIVIFIKI